MSWGLDWMIAVAKATADWSAGLGNVRAPPPAALLLAVAGFLWLALWRERWRLLGLVPMALAIPLALLAPSPGRSGGRGRERSGGRAATTGKLHVLGGKGAKFEVQYWLRADGDSRDAGRPRSLNADTACDPLGCVGHAGGKVVAFATRPEAFLDDCRLADVVISARTAPRDCGDGGRTVIDGPMLARGGAHALYAEGSGFRVVAAYPAVRRPFMPPARE